MKPARRRGAQPVSDLMAALMDPILARRSGMTSGLVTAWPEIVGPRLQDVTRPEKIAWPPRRDIDDPHEPATLVVACEGAAVLRLQHQSGEIIARVNAFFGYGAVDRMRIVQKPVHVQRVSRKPKTRPLAAAEEARIDAMVARIEDPALKRALEAYGRSVFARLPPRQG
ncbi:DUF721 domain-containing protein [Mangrovicella endophytica]|uniref:DUF721 domain-containing protein n=1 Tax=Mangrovicella endophytica TaxID=2066697 RepID=UPI000C9E85AB|nr:DciA family protein [Mangrovicella endophytica]